MIRNISILFFTLLQAFAIQAQSSFIFHIATSQDETIFGSIEDRNGNFVAVGEVSNYYWGTIREGFILVFDNSGTILKQIPISSPYTFVVAVNIFQKDNNNYLVFGHVMKNEKREIFVYEYDTDFNKIKSKYFTLPISNQIENMSIMRNHRNNIVVCGSLESDTTGRAVMPFFIEMTQNTDSVSAKYYSYPKVNWNQVFSIIEKPAKNGYYGLGFGFDNGGGKVLDIDSTLEIKSFKSIPEDIHNWGTIKSWSDTSYILTGKKNIGKKSKDQNDAIMCVILDTAHNILHEKMFDAPDTASVPGIWSSMDFIDRNNIFFGGTVGFTYSYFYLGLYSFIITAKTDSFLNTKWEKFYGGDACYVVTVVQATSNGGFLVFASRYDYLTQDNERDIVILKLDADGNLPTGVNDLGIKETELFVYPNPGSAQLTVRTAVQAVGGEFRMFDISGKTVLQTQINERFTNVSTNDLPEGIYLYQYILKGKVKESGKWIKSKQ
jgi:hypothetical protein